MERRLQLPGRRPWGDRVQLDISGDILLRIECSYIDRSGWRHCTVLCFGCIEIVPTHVVIGTTRWSTRAVKTLSGFGLSLNESHTVSLGHDVDGVLTGTISGMN